MKKQPWWIKERHNPQLKTYFVPRGQLPVREAKKSENPIYGFNIMHQFDSEGEYRVEIQRLRDNKNNVHPEEVEGR